MKIDVNISAKVFFIAIFFHSLSVYFLKTGLFGSALILAAVSSLSLYFLNGGFKFSTADIAFILAALMYFFVGITYVTFSSISGVNKVSYFISFSIPFYAFLAMKLLRYEPIFFIKLILYFMTVQLFIISGQISTYLLGIGLPVSENYTYMLTGSFSNSNDLAAVVLSCIIALVTLEKLNIQSRLILLLWLLAFILITLTASRTAIFLFLILLLFSKKISFLKISFPILICFILFSLFGFFQFDEMDSSPGSVTGRVYDRFMSIYEIFDKGLVYDGSLSLRTSSYLYFTSIFSELGLGSMDYEDYSKFFYKADFDFSLISKNPHSLLIELSYWQGYIGLTCLMLLTLASILYFRSRLLFFVGFIICYLFITAIPSSSLLLYPVIAMYFFVTIKPETESSMSKVFLTE